MRVGRGRMRRGRRVDVSTVGNAECCVAARDFGDSIKSLLTSPCVREHIRCSNPTMRSCIVGGNYPVVDKSNNERA